MPIPTPLMGLPYPGPLDAPCDFDEQWCGFTSAIDAVFDKWETGLNRAYPAIPAARMMRTEQMLIGNFLPIPFTAVDFDTAGMTNMDADPYGITVRKAGRFTVSAHVEEDDLVSAGSQLALIINLGGAGVVETSDVLTLAANRYRTSVYWPVVDLAEGTRVTLSTFLSSQPSRLCYRAWLAVSWHSDVRRPS